MPKRILIIFWGHPYFDGRCMNMIEQLSNQNYQVSVLGIGEKSETLRYKNTKINLINKSLLQNSITKYFKYFKYVKNYISKNNIDVIIASDLYSMIPCAQTKKYHKAKIIYDSRELYTKLAGLKNKPIIQKIWSWHEKKYIPDVDCVLVTANIDKAYLKQLYQFPKIKIVKNLPGQSFLNNKSIDLKEMFQLTKEHTVFLYQGKFHNGRGICFSIQSISKIKGAVLILIGEGPMKTKYLKIAEAYNMKGRIFFIESVPYQSLGSFAASADIGLSIIQPISKSYEHALPNKLFEYAISGLPCICSNLPAMQEMIETYHTGITINYNNEDEFINAYTKIMKHYDNYQLNSDEKEKLIWENNNQNLCEAINE